MSNNIASIVLGVSLAVVIWLTGSGIYYQWSIQLQGYELTKTIDVARDSKDEPTCKWESDSEEIKSEDSSYSFKWMVWQCRWADGTEAPNRPAPQLIPKWSY